MRVCICGRRNGYAKVRLNFKLVSSVGHTQNGFKNSAIVIRVMRTGLKVCGTYMRSDPEIVHYALLSIG